MHQNDVSTVVILGAGNVAWHMGQSLSGAGIQVKQIFSRNPKHGEYLARELKTAYTNRLDQLDKDADLFLLAVSDEVIPAMIQQAQFGKQLVVHLAGSVPMNVFGSKVRNHGVFYPLSTFTKGKPVDFSDIPFFIEASNEASLEKLRVLAGRLTRKVIVMDSEKRLYLHLAAVIASNFTNHMLALAEKLVIEKNISFDLLKPLIQETVAKGLIMSPLQAQTGPAVRGNIKTMAKHLSILEGHPEIQELYRLISESIASMKSEK
jgi:predicted short-subunit dehydrogenase-like oxidoreductase (DUF2520 family)